MYNQLSFLGMFAIDYLHGSIQVKPSLQTNAFYEIEFASYIDPVCLFKNVEEPHKSSIGYVKKLTDEYMTKYVYD